MKAYRQKAFKAAVSLLACAAMLFTLTPGQILPVTAEETEPDWSEYTPVSTPEELDAVRNDLSGKYYLTNDIVFSEDDFAKGGVFYNNGQGWKPIGENSNSAFTGIFDGDGYSIIGLQLNRSSDANVGVFGYNKGTIRNLGIKDSTITSTKVSGYAGGITGYNNGVMERCFNINTNVSIPYDGGGIAGHSDAGSRITDCYNTGTIRFTNNSSSGSVAGIVGYNQGGKIQNCYSIGNVTGNTSNIHGIANGTPDGGTNCYYLDTVPGGLTDKEMGDIATYSGFDFETVWEMETYPFLKIEKRGPYIPVTVLNLPQTLDIAARQTEVLVPDFGDTTPTSKRLTWESSDESVATVDSGGVVTGRSEGTAVITATAARGEKSASCTVTVARPEDAIAISTAEELNRIGYEYPLDGYYYLTADIDLTELTAPGGEYYNNGEGWEPIGNSDTPFTGVFDGKDHRIIGMTMNRPEANEVGLFGYADQALIRNLILTDGTVTGKDRVGGLIGKGPATLVYLCKVESGTITGNADVGGLAGSAEGSEFVQCTNSGTIEGANYVGGIVGNTKDGFITSCRNTGYINKDIDCGTYVYGEYAGGLAGYAQYISDSVNSGSITAKRNGSAIRDTDCLVGGIAGEVQQAIRCVNSGEISYTGMATWNPYYRVTYYWRARCGGIAGKAQEIRQSYNSGSIAGTIGSGGGLVGYFGSGTYLTDCYNLAPDLQLVGVNSDTFHFTHCYNIGNGIATDGTAEGCYYLHDGTYGLGERRNQRQMQLQNTYQGWDFENTWQISPGRYPTLRHVPFVPATGISLTETEGVLYIGETVTLTPTFEPADATYQKVAYSSNNTAVATVDESGVITPAAPGTAVITVKADDGGATARYTVEVRRHPTGITLSDKEVTIAVPDEYQLTAEVTLADSYNKNVMWDSSDDMVATVDQNGLVKAVKAGTATITAKTEDGGLTATCTVTVTQPVLGLEIEPADVTVKVGETAQIVPKILPDDATIQTVTYSSSDSSVATVTSAGVITGKKPGTAEITVKSTDGGFVQTCTVTVIRVATGIRLDVTSKTLTVDDTYKPTLTFIPADTTDQSVVWTSSDDAVASVSEDGTVTAKKAGFAKITAKANDGGFTASYTVTVIQPAEGITLPETATVYIGTPLKLHAVLLPEDVTDKKIKWETSDPAVAIVDSNGTVTGIMSGTVTITAKTAEDAFSDSCTVTVLQPVTGVTLNKSELLLETGDGDQLIATLRPDTASNKEVTWDSSAPEIVSVDENGKIRAMKAGDAIVTVTTRDGEFTAQCHVVVRQPVTGIALDQKEMTLNVGVTQKLTATVYPDNAFTKAVQWSSSDDTVVAVNQTGVLTALKAGNAVITAMSSDGSYTAECKVTVLQPVTGVALNKQQTTLFVGQGEQLIASLKPDDASEREVIWTSSENAIVSVDKAGRISALQKGTAVITVTTIDGDYTAKCYVTVKEVADNILLTETKLTLREKDTHQLHAAILPEEVEMALTWRSSSPEVVAVNQSGFLTAIRAGTATITVETESGLQAHCTVTVIPPFDIADEYAPKGGYIVLGAGVQAGTLKELLETTCDVEATDAQGGMLAPEQCIATGCRIKLTNDKSETVEYTAVIQGDLDGNGESDALDAYMLAQYLVGNLELSEAQKRAADMNATGSLDSLDLLLLKKRIMGD